jgi:predicted enzyme related to lactoylglutathione lyase
MPILLCLLKKYYTILARVSMLGFYVLASILKSISKEGENMLRDSKAFSGFSVNNLAAAKDFYGQTLGLDVAEDAMGLTLKLAGGNNVFVYAKDDHAPATYTILNFPVEDIDQAVEDLVSKGVTFEHYDNMTDDKGVARGIATQRGPDIAWFKDPAGNVLSVLHEA